MRLLGNIIWVVLGGFVTAIEYFTASIPLFLSIIGIPFGIQIVKIGILQLWPFGVEIEKKEDITSGCLYSIVNILWFIFAGIPIFLSHIFFGILLAITIIGIPFSKQHFKLAGLALSPFGKELRYPQSTIL
ncbi:MAG: YccF domain-containing protein [Chitinophagales bacterium]|nr:YccF domain-containing protein [Chitinophagales bacterium]